MALSVLRKNKPEQYLRSVFECRYDDILRWALQLTDFDRSAAEELVHDAYVDLALSHTDIQQASNPDGYLYRVLRNLNASRIKRAWKHEHDALDVLELDSIYLRLRTGKGVDQIDLQDRLIQLCGYLCSRKESFRPASVLLLRFFRGFYPDEIARLSGLEPASVRKQIERARCDARVFLMKPDKDGATAASSFVIPAPEPRQAAAAERFLHRLAATIRLSLNGPCFTVAEIGECYGQRDAHPLEAERLSHLVSCDLCLSAVCKFLSMNPPDDRLPFDSAGQNRDAARKVLNSAERTIQELRNHEPSSLVLAINGDDIYECNVGHGQIRHTVTVPVGITLEFFEIFSHVGLRLLRLDVESRPPDGPPEIRNYAVLGAGRELSLCLEWYGQEPRVRVELSALEEPAVSVVASGMHPVSIAPPSLETGTEGAEDAPESMWRRLLDWLGTHSLIPAIVLVLAGALTVFGWLNGNRKPELDASAILTQASHAELAAASHGVAHRVVSFEEVSATGAVVRSGRVESWNGGAESAKRFYDTKGHLTAGEWKSGDGLDKVLEDGKLHSQPASRDCVAGEEFWNCDLSAQSFGSMAAAHAARSRTETPGAYVITFANPVTSNDRRPQVVRAVLTIDRRSMRSQKALVWVRNQGMVQEYRYVEVSYEPNTGTSLDSPIFRPDVDLQSRRQRKVPRWEPGGTSAQLVHLQLQVLLRLHAIGDDVGQPLLVERTHDGKLSVRGVVASDSEAQRIRGALSDLATNPLILIRVYSANEWKHLRSSGHTGKLSVESYEVNAEHSPADHLLRSHFESLGFHGTALDEQIRAFSNNVLSQSAQALQQAWALHQFSRSFTEAELVSLSIEDKRTWFALLNDHENAVAATLDQLRKTIAWMIPSSVVHFPASGVAPEARPPTEAVDQVLSSTSELNQLLQAELVVTAGGDGEPATNPAAISTVLEDAQSSLLSIQTFSQQYNALMMPQGPR